MAIRKYEYAEISHPGNVNFSKIRRQEVSFNCSSISLAGAVSEVKTDEYAQTGDVEIKKLAFAERRI